MERFRRGRYFHLILLSLIDLQDESTEEIQETESQLSMTYVPSENQSLAQLIPEDVADQGITVEIKPEVLLTKSDTNGHWSNKLPFCFQIQIFVSFAIKGGWTLHDNN